MKYFKYYSPQSHKKMKNLAVVSLEAMSLTPEEDVSFGPLHLPVAWESQDVRSPPENGQEPQPAGGASFRGVCKAGNIFMSGRHGCYSSVQWTEKFRPVLFPQHSGSHLQSSQQKGILILSPLCPFLGPGREALTSTHSIAASTSNSQIKGTALIALGMQLCREALPQTSQVSSPRIKTSNHCSSHTGICCSPPPPNLKDTQPICVSPHILQPVFMH